LIFIFLDKGGPVDKAFKYKTDIDIAQRGGAKAIMNQLVAQQPVYENDTFTFFLYGVSLVGDRLQPAPEGTELELFVGQAGCSHIQEPTPQAPARVEVAEAENLMS
jgi:hypothetical protein